MRGRASTKISHGSFINYTHNAYVYVLLYAYIKIREIRTRVNPLAKICTALRNASAKLPRMTRWKIARRISPRADRHKCISREYKGFRFLAVDDGASGMLRDGALVSRYDGSSRIPGGVWGHEGQRDATQLNFRANIRYRVAR